LLISLADNAEIVVMLHKDDPFMEYVMSIAYGTFWGRRGVHAAFVVEKPDEMTSLRIRMVRWEDTIKVDVKEIGWKSVDWVYLAEDGDNWRAVVNMA
jgi:hypothetical protein